MEHKTKTIIWEDNNEPPKNYLWVKSDGKVYEFNYTDRKWEESKMISSANADDDEGDISINDHIMRIISIVKEDNYDFAGKGYHVSPEVWEDFASGLPDNTEVVGQYSENTSNVVEFTFLGESESEDTFHTIVFLLSDDDYALVPTAIESEDEDEEDPTSYFNGWVNDVTQGEYTSIEDVPKVESQGYYEGWSLAGASTHQAESGITYKLEGKNNSLILGFNATWETMLF